ncbi:MULTISPECIES: hypothetical protein [Paenibacillus]|uniref:hypothetical protein n=1 Tax=Paenibacillus TaxID=44249 RepID=UPI0022B8D8A0|nr:hypothetical protein [Paenibacillus caseinilyticus]MCZ8518495.1 hypothetical protein [Paenibacillus caseinilyticus]
MGRKRMGMLIMVIMLSGLLLVLNQRGTSEVKAEVATFYELFSRKDFGSLYHKVSPSSHGELMNYRWQYGEMKNYKIVSIWGLSPTKKKVKVRVVTTNEKDKEITDTFILKKERGLWLLDDYDNNLGIIGP